MIRPATENDIKSLRELMGHIQAPHAAAHPDIFKPSMDCDEVDRFFEGILTKKGHRILLHANGEIANGYIWFEMIDRQEDMAHLQRRFGYIHHIGVAPKMRFQGVGTLLIMATKEVLQAEGIERIGVDYWAFNTRAARFFEKLGLIPQRVIAFCKT